MHNTLTKSVIKMENIKGKTTLIILENIKGKNYFNNVILYMPYLVLRKVIFIRWLEKGYQIQSDSRTRKNYSLVAHVHRAEKSI